MREQLDCACYSMCVCVLAYWHKCVSVCKCAGKCVFVCLSFSSISVKKLCSCICVNYYACMRVYDYCYVCFTCVLRVSL